MHFAPGRNWLNDPNGLVFHNGRYHLFFQYNPEGIDHGSISWGHSSSTDLVRWEEHPVALRATAEFEIYSGSAVADDGNSSGFGTPSAPALVAIYTAHSLRGRHQAQALAYSIDEGETWSFYDGNPVLDRGSGDFRDPKVFGYHTETESYWVMIAVEALDQHVVLYRSADLKSWDYLSTYGPAGPLGGVWECPDLFPLAVDGNTDDVRWVLLLSLSPGGVAGGSGTHYVIGSFDGVTFTPDESVPDLQPGSDRTEMERLSWLDYGRDCYAGVTFSGLPRDQRTLIAWMSNWDYAKDLPYDEDAPQRGRMTLARRLSLVTRDGRVQLAQEAVGPDMSLSHEVAPQHVTARCDLGLQLPEICRLEVRLRLDDDADGIVLDFGADPETAVRLGYDVHESRVWLDRRRVPGHPPAFCSLESMPVEGGREISWTLWIGHSSIELFTDGGTRAFTNLTGGQAGPTVWFEPLGGGVTLDELSIYAAE